MKTIKKLGNPNFEISWENTAVVAGTRSWLLGRLFKPSLYRGDERVDGAIEPSAEMSSCDFFHGRDPFFPHFLRLSCVLTKCSFGRAFSKGLNGPKSVFGFHVWWSTCTVFSSRVTKDAEIQKLRRVSFSCQCLPSGLADTVKRDYFAFFAPSSLPLNPFFSVSCATYATAVPPGLMYSRVTNCWSRVNAVRDSREGKKLLFGYIDIITTTFFSPWTHCCDLSAAE